MNARIQTGRPLRGHWTWASRRRPWCLACVRVDSREKPGARQAFWRDEACPEACPECGGELKRSPGGGSAGAASSVRRTPLAAKNKATQDSGQASWRMRAS